MPEKAWRLYLLPPSKFVFPNVEFASISMPKHAVAEYYLGWSRSTQHDSGVDHVRDALLEHFVGSRINSI